MAKEQIPQAVKEGRKRKRYEYPLNNPDDYLGRLVFTVLEEPPSDLGNLVGAITSAGESLASMGKSLVTGEERTPEEKIKDEEKLEGLTNLPIQGVQELIDTGRSVQLYMPAGLQYRDTVNYENMDLGGLGATTERALQSGSGVLNTLIEGGMSTLSSGLTGAGGKDLAAVGTMKLASKMLPTEIAGAFRSAGQVTTNPNTRVLFKSVNLREFMFAFKFMATSQKEAEEVKQIIKFFRTELYPEDINLELGNGNAISVGYRFPNKFRIDVLYDGKDVATRIKPCFLRDVNVTYNPTSQTMHSDGNFQEIEMSLAFQETKTLSRKDIDDDDEFGGGF